MSFKPHSLKKQFILRFHEEKSWYDKNAQSLLLELAPHRLSDVLSGKLNLSMNQRLHIAFYSLQGLCYAHAAKVPHRDIKPANILLTAKLVPKIGDWGMCENHSPKVGTRNYMAPELYREWDRDYENLPDYYKVDAWSMGLTIYYLLCGTNFVFSLTDEQWKAIGT
jgi:serine/threonine protein kinase